MRRFLNQLKFLAIYMAAALVLGFSLLLVLALLLLTTPLVRLAIVFLLAILLALTLAGMWKTFAKVGQPGWKAIVPVYNVLILLRVTRHPWWWLLLLFFPPVWPLLLVKLSVDISRSFGLGIRFGVGLALLPFVCWPLLGFGEYTCRSDGLRTDRDPLGQQTYQGGGHRTDRDRVIKAVEWSGNIDNPAFGAATVETLRSRSLSSLTSHKLRFTIEVVEAYQEVGAADIDLDDDRQSMISTWEAKTGADWETVKTA